MKRECYNAQERCHIPPLTVLYEYVTIRMDLPPLTVLSVLM